MKKSFYDKHFKHGRLTACMPLHLGYIAFILNDDVDTENLEHYDEEGALLHRSDLATRLVVYSPSTVPVGEYGIMQWDYGIDNLI